MIHLYEYFVLCGTNLLSFYWRQATNDKIDEFDSANNTWNKGDFAKIMTTNENKTLSREIVVAAEDVFYSFLQRALKKPNDMTPKAFKARFDVLMKLYKDLETEFELIIGERERKLIFFNAIRSSK